MEYKLEAKVDLDSNTTMVKPITHDKWLDFGIWLEALGFMANIARTEKNMSEEQVAEHAKKYLLKAMADYKTINDPSTKNKA